MQLSLKWLNEYVDVKEFFAQPEVLGEKLTSAGLELEGIVNQCEQFKNIVIGKIIEKENHADADKLTVCQVDIGQKNLQQIVCGAKNHRAGDLVVAALPGAILPGDFAIKKSKIRGVESLGMLCSEKELGLANESEGILIIKGNVNPGMSAAEYLGLDDIIFDISVTPNRADCLSHIGLAREVSCLTGKAYKKPSVKLKCDSYSYSKLLKVSVADSEQCPRYTGRVLRGVKVGPSPDWLKARLEGLGLNSINNIVDVTNFVMMEMGQPLHAFDLGQLKGPEIKVSLAKKGEKFKTLDGTELTLVGEELMIRDGERPVCMAGVIGGLNSGVSESTKDIFLESAYFAQDTVRRSSRTHGIETDSSYRFARGIDPNGVVEALERATDLIQQVAGGTCSKDVFDNYPKPIQREEIKITKAFIEQKMGYSIDEKLFLKYMEQLGCVVKGTATAWQVLPPAYRWDIYHDVDLVEEFARLYGYEKIGETMPSLNVQPSNHCQEYLKTRRLERLLISTGFQQAFNYHFINADEQLKLLGDVSRLAQLGIKNAQFTPIPVMNPLNEDVNAMRVSLVPGLVRNLINNYRQGNYIGRLYEIGQVFRKDNQEYVEDRHIGFCAWGQVKDLWLDNLDRPVVYDIKVAIEKVLSRESVTGFEWRNLDDSSAPSFLHPGQSASLFFRGHMIGYIGTLHPKIKAQHKIRHSVAFGELNSIELEKAIGLTKKYEPISRMQPVERDLAFVIPIETPSASVERELSKAGGRALKGIQTFDLYEGDKVGKGFRSVAYKLTFQEQDKTFSEQELIELQARLINSVEKKLGIKVRV